jgi:hypothetical protein
MAAIAVSFRYLNRVRGAGVKLWLDGSPPTALLSEPYKNMQDASDTKYIGVEVRTCMCMYIACCDGTSAELPCVPSHLL